MIAIGGYVRWGEHGLARMVRLNRVMTLGSAYRGDDEVEVYPKAQIITQDILIYRHQS